MLPQYFLLKAWPVWRTSATMLGALFRSFGATGLPVVAGAARLAEAAQPGGALGGRSDDLLHDGGELGALGLREHDPGEVAGANLRPGEGVRGFESAPAAFRGEHHRQRAGRPPVLGGGLRLRCAVRIL
jgi:hypothetical protein